MTFVDKQLNTKLTEIYTDLARNAGGRAITARKQRYCKQLSFPNQLDDTYLHGGL